MFFIKTISVGLKERELKMRSHIKKREKKAVQM